MSKGDFSDQLLGPISKKYCLYFYALMVFFLFFLVLSLVGVVFALFSKSGGMFPALGALSMSILYGAMYLQARLFYNMCVGTMV
jgi:hypothetical protein